MNQDTTHIKHHKQTGLENNAHYLHFRYRFGFLDNFTVIYTALMAKCEQDGLEVSFDSIEAFFQAFVESMGLQAEFESRTIDPRTFTLKIVDTSEHHYECISAGQLITLAPVLINIIAKPHFFNVHLVLGETTYSLSLRNEG